ncbi:hypothetical protein GUITHDRAFT_145764 [Guillardia theta CCMP2712]|uniref:Uncharacterized protein n=2 Tax=Guillardia theta TaxID=55529 RepID=L1IKS5_GUITC|nr:hypothetical protein GUITHDRAFT_145764 [Guillardia theta CCMP2712]EKX36395.1 hypothetical protein GUITHDRAFT_145764 [Guillardia theta CCMP2712]|eukprot:XP_005823375.1 hypothetical protein GUITHDRAFT_145764 [Guillardia theta CCMP2712]
MAWAPAPASSPSSLSLLTAPACSPSSPSRLAGLRIARQDPKGVTCLQCSEGCERRQVLQGIGASVLSWALTSAAPSFAAVKDDVTEKVEKIPLEVLAAMAGGSAKEYEEVKGSFTPQQPLEGIELELFRLYKYATTKMDGSGDPRTSLRTVFLSKVGDSLFKYAEDNGIKPKVYDARGDGLTNGGKGGVLKGLRVLMEGLKKQGLIEDFNIDTSTHEEIQWQQANPSSITLTTKKPVGLAAATAMQAEKDRLSISLPLAFVTGYLKQCKVIATAEEVLSGDEEKLTLNLNWAGKARLASSVERRVNDKFNAARSYK